MDSDGLHLDIDYVASSGVILSVEQKAALQSSLIILKTQQQFRRIQFWGKILGYKMDYFIVQGVGKDELKDRKTLYSLDCIKWGLLQLPDDDTKRRCLLLKGRFTGDPSHEYEYAEKVPGAEEGEQDEDEDNANMVLVKEEDRLATIISAIDAEVAIVPRAAYIRAPTGEVFQNRMFEGLSAAEAGRLSSYFHYREPIFLQEKTLLQKADLDKAIDFLDPIDTDIPHNACLLKKERYERALDYANKAVDIEPKNTKALFRRGTSNFNLKNFNAAESDFNTVLEINPKETAVRKYLKAIDDEKQKGLKKQQEMYSKMF